MNYNSTDLIMTKIHKHSHKFKSLQIALIAVTILYLASLALAGGAEASSFADPAFGRIWGTTDQLVASGQAARTWMWGPSPITTEMEDYANAPGGKRLVQYFDKSRMEITNPAGDANSQWYVTNGLLTKELVSGRLQLGDSQFREVGAAKIPVAGDPDNSGPTYASFQSVASLNGDRRAAAQSGALVNQSIDNNGNVGSNANFNKYGVRNAAYNNELGHNIPSVFWNWMNGLSVNWVFAMGYPISEPMWAQVKVGGQSRDVLIQLFERRVLTYNPANAAAWQVEMGNIGRHYFQWRYGYAPDQLNNEEKVALDLINAERAKSGLAPVQFDATLTAIARARSTDMALKGYFSHTQPDGKTFQNYLNDYKVQWHSAGEIIGKTNASADQTASIIMNGWLHSPTHSSIIHTGDYQNIGIGEAIDASGYRYLTAIFDKA